MQRVLNNKGLIEIYLSDNQADYPQYLQKEFMEVTSLISSYPML